MFIKLIDFTEKTINLKGENLICGRGLVGKIPAFHAGDPGFKSRRPHLLYSKLLFVFILQALITYFVI